MVLELFPYKPIKLVFQALKIAKPTLEFTGFFINEFIYILLFCENKILITKVD